METNFSFRNYTTVKKDSAEAKTVKEAGKKDFSDAVIDGTNTNQAELLKDVEGAINTGENVFIRTDKGIIKIDKDKVPEVLTALKEKLAKNEEYNVTGIGLDRNLHEFKVDFKKAPEAVRSDAIYDADVKKGEAGSKAHVEYNREIKSALKISDPEKRAEALNKAGEKYEAGIKKANDGFIADLKTINSKYLEEVKKKDPENYEEIKEDIGIYLTEAEKAINQNTSDLTQAIKTHVEAKNSASNIQDPKEREVALKKATDDHNDAIVNVIRPGFISTMEKIDNNFGIQVTYDKGGLAAANSKADTGRIDALNEANTKKNETGSKANKEYNADIAEALKISDPAKRAEALNNAGTKFKDTIQKVNDQFITDVKAANQKYLDDVKSADPEHYPHIKLEVENYIGETEKAVKMNNSDILNAINTHVEAKIAAGNITDPKERAAAVHKATTDYSDKMVNNIRVSYNKAIETADNKFSVMVAMDRDGTVAAVNKADSLRSDAISYASDTKIAAGTKANDLYNQEVENALKISDPGKRAEALHNAANKFEAAIKSANEQFVKDVKTANKDYLEIIFSVDPGHYEEVQKASEQHVASIEKAVQQNNAEFGPAIQKHIEDKIAASNLKNPQEKAAAIHKASVDYNALLKDTVRNNLTTAFDNADSKYAADLGIIMSIKPAYIADLK
jgi:hypothetical protein